MPEKYKVTFFDPKFKIVNQLATLAVAIGLCVFAYVVAANEIITGKYFSQENYHLFGKVIGAIFLVRAIGDFRLFGVFKKEGGDLFSKRDTRIYIPLCLFLGIGSLIVSIH